MNDRGRKRRRQMKGGEETSDNLTLISLLERHSVTKLISVRLEQMGFEMKSALGDKTKTEMKDLEQEKKSLRFVSL